MRRAIQPSRNNLIRLRQGYAGTSPAKGEGKPFSSFSFFKEKVGMRYYMAMFLLLSLTIGCDGDGPLKPGEFEDPAFAKCVKDRIDYAISIGLWQKDDPDIYNKVEELACEGGGVSSLKGIENMPNINHLAVTDNEIESLEPLRTLTKLTFLKLNNNKIRDLEPVSNLPMLNALFLNDNYVNDISCFYDTQSLTYAELADNCIPKEQLLTMREKHPQLPLGVDLDNYVIPEKCQ